MVKKRLAILGATGSGLKRTIPALVHSSMVEVVAVQARNVEKLQAIEAKYGIRRCYTDAEKLISDGEFDFVFIATPPFLHLDNLRLAVRSGLPIVCEKPLAQNLSESERIYALLKNYHAPFMLAHHLRHQDAIRDIKAAIQAGDIGYPTAVWCQWGFQLNEAASNAQWKLKPDLGGVGPFADAGIHMIDIVLHLFGEPRKVAAHSFCMKLPFSADNTSAILCYDNCSIMLNAAQNMPFPGNHLLIYGTKGKIEAHSAIGEKSIKEVHYQVGPVLESRKYPEINLYAAEVESFAAVISGLKERHPGTDLEQAMTGMRILDAIQRSSDTNSFASL